MKLSMDKKDDADAFQADLDRAISLSLKQHSSQHAGDRADTGIQSGPEDGENDDCFPELNTVSTNAIEDDKVEPKEDALEKNMVPESRHQEEDDDDSEASDFEPSDVSEQESSDESVFEDESSDEDVKRKKKPVKKAKDSENTKPASVKVPPAKKATKTAARPSKAKPVLVPSKMSVPLSKPPKPLIAKANKPTLLVHTLSDKSSIAKPVSSQLNTQSGAVKRHIGLSRQSLSRVKPLHPHLHKE